MNMNSLPRPNQAPQPELKETKLRKRDQLVLQQPVLSEQAVETATGIRGYQYMGEVVVPQHLDADNNITHTVSFDVFRAGLVQEGGVTYPVFSRLNNSSSNSPAAQLMLNELGNHPGSVTVISRSNLERLMELNGRDPALRSDTETEREHYERQQLPTTIVKRGNTVTFGRSGEGKDIIGADAEAASRQHFTLTVSEQGVIIGNLGGNGTFVKAASQPQAND